MILYKTAVGGLLVGIQFEMAALDKIESQVEL